MPLPTPVDALSVDAAPVEILVAAIPSYAEQFSIDEIRKLKMIAEQGADFVLLPGLQGLLVAGMIKQVRGGFLLTAIGSEAHQYFASRNLALQWQTPPRTPLAPSTPTQGRMSIAA